jgi:hypothetical protein
MWMAPCIYFYISNSTMKHIRRVHNDAELTMYASMRHQALISNELYVQLSAVPSASYLLCKSVLKMDNYKFRKYSDMHLILS